jgi:hypothetical protein
MATENGPGRSPEPTAIHLSLQGKGGVGKSLVASILAQYLMTRGRTVKCVDTDPLNQTLLQYEALQVQHLKLLRDGTVDQRGFDHLIDRVLTEDGVFVVDNGSSTFIPLWHYILQNDVLRLLHEAGRNLYVHTVITGGQALLDTLDGFRQLAESTGSKNIIVWINEFFGRVECDGKEFSQMNVYQRNAAKVLGSVGIPKRNQDTFGRDVEEMVARKLTFDEAITGAGSTIMTKQRLKIVQRELFEQLDKLCIA